MEMSKSDSTESLNETRKFSNRKRDILYSKAKDIQNQRLKIEKLCFAIRPDTEITNAIFQDLDKYVPEENKFSNVESTILIESFHREQPMDTKEINIHGFFPYIYSEEWKIGCSVRVLKGKLLDELLLGLYRLEKNKVIARQTAHAFAKNHQQIKCCYTSSSAKACGCREYTLLIEFTYFGRIVKDHIVRTSYDSWQYRIPAIYEMDRLTIVNALPRFCVTSVSQTPHGPAISTSSHAKPSEVRNNNTSDYHFSSTVKREQRIHKLKDLRNDMNMKHELATNKLHAEKLEHDKRNTQRKQAELEKRLKNMKLPKIIECTNDTLPFKALLYPDHVPTLEEFVQLLKDDDPKCRNKERARCKRMSRLYQSFKENHGSIDSTTARIPSLILKMGKERPDTESERNEVEDSDIKLCLQDYGNLSNEVLGVTDSKPCRYHFHTFRKHQFSSKPTLICTNTVFHCSAADLSKFTKLIPRNILLKQHLLASDAYSFTGTHSVTHRKHKLIPLQTKTEKPSNVVQTTLLGKITRPSLDEEFESITTSTESDEENKDDAAAASVFNGNKLNIKYSVELMRKAKKGKDEAKPLFGDMLAKYSKFQFAAKAIRKTSKVFKSRSAKLKKTRYPKNNEGAPEEKPKMIIGKLKEFSFLDHKSEPRMTLDTSCKTYFPTHQLEKFHEQLLKSLDDFIVRREIIVSDIHTFNNASTSMTFTRIACFNRIHKNC